MVPSGEGPPDDAPEQCALCGDGDPVWWYVVEPLRDTASRLVASAALARWWAICAGCDRLISLGAVDRVRERVVEGRDAAARQVVDEFLGSGQRWGPITTHQTAEGDNT